MVVMSCTFAGLYAYVAHRPALLADGVDPVLVRASIVRFSAVGLVLYVGTVVVAIFSAPLCLLAHFAIALYYCFSQIRTAAPEPADQKADVQGRPTFTARNVANLAVVGARCRTVTAWPSPVRVMIEQGKKKRAVRLRL